jgi:hypothetical protein
LHAANDRSVKKVHQVVKSLAPRKEAACFHEYHRYSHIPLIPDKAGGKEI